MLVNFNEVLEPARQGGYAVGLFNAVNLELARGIFDAAEETGSPVIVGTAEILLPFGPLEELSWFLLPMAKRARIPVVVHFDHGLTREACLKALDLGFTSIMYDCSTDSYEENVKKVTEMAGIAHSYGATIEGELGHVGEAAGGEAQRYTDPAQAADYVERTGVDALAVAVGTAHGAYKLPPKLDFERIRTISGKAGVPLVLHGGSGLSDADFKEAIRAGISKVNIFTDINTAAARAEAEAYEAGKGLTDLISPAVKAVSAETKKKMELFGSCGKGTRPTRQANGSNYG